MCIELGILIEMSKKSNISPKLDTADRSLLQLLQEDVSQTMESLAAQTGLSTSAVQRRVQRLRDEKIIAAEVAVLAPRVMGQLLTFIVELELERDRPELMPALLKWINAQEAIQQCWYVTGRGDYMLVILAPTVEAFDGLMEKLMDQNRNVRKFTTSLALRTVKQSLRIPINT
jgi:Lrp/AsnC family transcriptional regulator, leucine-responsive regulatory protein